MDASSISDYEESEGEYNDGLYLDEETYLQAEATLLRPDGSLNFNERQDKQGKSMTDFPDTAASSQSYPPVPKIKNKTYQAAVEGLFSPAPSYSYSNDDGNNDSQIGITDQLSNPQQQLSDEERLYQTVMDIEGGKSTQQMMDPETLHQQVFAEEQAYLQQSEEFRKSLSTLYTDEESPMAKERREAVNQCNEKVLNELMKEMDEMEGLAISRDDAMRQAKDNSPTTNKQAKDVIICFKCGLRVTSDMIQRAETIEIAKGGGGVQKKKINAVESCGILCQSCYRQQLHTKDEATVRLGAGSFGGSSSARTFDKNNPNSWQQTGGEKYRGGKKERRRSGRNGGRGSVQGIDMSSLFKEPKGYDTERKNNTAPKTSVDSKRPSSNTPSGGQKMPPRRTSRVLGGGELAKRRQQQQPESSDEDLEQQTTQRTERSFKSQKFERTASPTQRMERTLREEINSEDSSEIGKLEEKVGEERVPSSPISDDDFSSMNTRIEQPMENNIDNWVKVEDPGSKRMFYWNTETGEMKKTLD